MLNIPEEVKTLLKTDSVRKNFRVHFPNGDRTDITNDNIISESVVLNESICSRDILQFGLCESPRIEFECFGIENIKGKTIECSIEIYCDSSVTGAVYRDDLEAYVYPIPYGRFIVDSCVKQADMTKRKVVGFSSFDFGRFDDNFIVLPFSNAIYKVKETGRESNLKLNIGAYVRALATTRDNMVAYGGAVESILYPFMSGGTQYCAKIYYKSTNPLIGWTGDSDSKVLRYDIDDGFMRDFDQLNSLYPEITYLYDKYINPPIYTNPKPFYRSAVSSTDYYFETMEATSIRAVSNRNNKNIIIAFREISTTINSTVYNSDIFNWPGANTDNIDTTFWGTSFKVEIYAGADDSGEMVSSTGDYRNSCNLLRNDVGKIILKIDQHSTDLLFLIPKRTYENIKLYKNRTSTTVKQNLYLCDFREIFSMNLREIIGAYCELQGKFGQFSRTGALNLKRIEANFDTPNAGTLSRSIYRKVWYEDYMSKPIGKIECTYTNEVGVETYMQYNLVMDYDSRIYKSYDISNNFFIKNNKYSDGEIFDIMHSMADNISTDITYMPSSIECLGLPHVEPGDVFEVETDNGNFISLVEKRTLSGIMALTDIYESEDSESSEASGASSSAHGGVTDSMKPLYKVLWNNPDPAASFSSQTVTLSDSSANYDYLGVLCMSGSGQRIVPMTLIPRGTEAVVTLAGQRNYQRPVTNISGTSLTFGSCTYYSTYGSSNTSTANGTLIPYQIIGFKQS